MQIKKRCIKNDIVSRPARCDEISFLDEKVKSVQRTIENRNERLIVGDTAVRDSKQALFVDTNSFQPGLDTRTKYRNILRM